MAFGVILPVTPSTQPKSITLTYSGMQEFDPNYFIEHCYSGHVENLIPLHLYMVSKKYSMKKRKTELFN